MRLTDEEYQALELCTKATTGRDMLDAIGFRGMLDAIGAAWGDGYKQKFDFRKANEQRGLN